MAAKLSKSDVWPLVKQTGTEWLEDKAPKMAASLAFYTATSIAPLIVAALGIFTLVARDKFNPQQLHDTLARLTDPSVADTLNGIINNPKAGHASLVATVVGIIVAVFSASGVFGELQDSLNTVWEVRPKPGRGIWGMVHDRFLTLSMVLGVAFLLLVSTVLTSVLSGVSAGTFGGVLGSGAVAKAVLMVVTFVVTTGVVTVLFAAMFKLLPDAKIAWRDVWIGAVLTAVLFQVGKLGLSLYIGKAAPGSAFGAIGAIVVLLVWVYYSAQILFFGAEFTQVYANKFGSRIVPADNAEPLTEEMRRKAGLPHAADSASHPDRTTSTAAAKGRDKASPPKVAATSARPSPRQPAAAVAASREVGPARSVRLAPVARHRSRASWAALASVASVVGGIILGRLAWRRYHATPVKAEEMTQTWRTVAGKWQTLGKLFVAKAGERYALTHGPSGAKGRTWADLAGKRPAT